MIAPASYWTRKSQNAATLISEIHTHILWYCDLSRCFVDVQVAGEALPAAVVVLVRVAQVHVSAQRTISVCVVAHAEAVQGASTAAHHGSSVPTAVSPRIHIVAHASVRVSPPAAIHAAIRTTIVESAALHSVASVVETIRVAASVVEAAPVIRSSVAEVSGVHSASEAAILVCVHVVEVMRIVVMNRSFDWRLLMQNKLIILPEICPDSDKVTVFSKSTISIKHSMHCSSLPMTWATRSVLCGAILEKIFKRHPIFYEEEKKKERKT